MDKGDNQPSLPRTLLIGLALILCGVLLGILAAKFFPVSDYSEPSTLPTISPTGSTLTQNQTPDEYTPVVITVTPELTPTATPSSLMSLRWNLITVLSPLDTFKSYKLHYPSTWSIKSQKTIKSVVGGEQGSSTVILTKGSTTFTIQQLDAETANCTYPDTTEENAPFTNYDSFRELAKSAIVWRWGQATPALTEKNVYYVCEEKTPKSFSAATSIGVISLNGSIIDGTTLEEFNYILEKIEILK